MNSEGEFARMQPEYAARGIATFPVSFHSKKPAITNYSRVGKPASAKLAAGYHRSVDAFGFALGPRSRVTVLDVDSADERVFAEAIDRHGGTPILVRSGSGHFQAWYRHAGEKRAIRPDPSVPIDILGGGYVVAPTSRVAKGQYTIIQGKLDDLDALPELKLAHAPTPEALREECRRWRDMREGSGRNDALFRQLGREVRYCDDFDQLLDVAQGLNVQFAEPMSDAEVVKTAKSIWKMNEEGRNRLGGQRGAWLSMQQVLLLTSDPYLMTLLCFLKANNGPEATFIVADGLRLTPEFSGWSREAFAGARRRAVEGEWISQISPPLPSRAATYVWGKRARGEVSVEDSLRNYVGDASRRAA